MADRSYLGKSWRFPVAINLTGGISSSSLEENVRESMFIILGTAPGERVQRKEWGCRIHDLMFEPNNYVTASRALGESTWGVLTRRIMPNSITPIVVAGTLGIGAAVLEIAALAFIGVTGDVSRAEWGSMIGLERNQLFSAPHIILAPGIAIVLTVLAFNLLGDGLRDALDPRLNR